MLVLNGLLWIIKEKLQGDNSFIMKFVSGSISGTLGVLVGNPFDVMKTLSITNTGKNDCIKI